MKKDYFIPKMYKNLFIPSLISAISFAFADIADAFVLGHTIGKSRLAAIGICLPIFMLINTFMDGFAFGGSIRFSQLLGNGKKEEATDCFNRIWLTVLFIGICIAAVINIFPDRALYILGARNLDAELYSTCEKYMRLIAFGSPALMLNIVFYNFLRNDNNARRAAAGLIVGNLVDIGLNFFFVMFLKLETVGAALATIIGSLIAISIYMPAIISGKANILCIKRVKRNRKEIAYCFRTGFSTSVQNILQFVFLIIVNNLLMNIGGKDAVAIFDLIYNISLFIIYVINGASEASQPLISTFSGEGSLDDCRTTLHLLKVWGIGACTLVTAILFIFAEKISFAFGITEDISALSVYAIRVYCISYVFISLNTIYEHYYQSMEKYAAAMIISILKRFALLVPCALILSKFGIYAIWFMFPLTEALTSFLVYLYRLKTHKDKYGFDKNRILRIMIGKENQDMDYLLKESLEFCKSQNVDKNHQYYVTLIIEEICTSIIRNAIKNDPNGKIRITLFAMPDGDFRLNIIDNAVKFNPFSAKKSKKNDAEADIDEMSINIVKSKSKEFMYRQCSGFNSLVIKI